MSVFITNYDNDVFQIPGINTIYTRYDSDLKIFEVFVNQKKIKRLVGIPADEAKIYQDSEKQLPEVIKLNRGLRKVFGVDLITLKTRSRKRIYVLPRQAAMTWMSNHTKNSLAEIGKFFKPEGLPAFDHATVLHCKKTIYNLIDTEKGFKEKYEEFDKVCQNIQI